MSNLEELDCEALLDLLRIKSRVARRLEEQLTEIRRQSYQLERDREAANIEVRDVLRELEAKAAQ